MAGTVYLAVDPEADSTKPLSYQVRMFSFPSSSLREQNRKETFERGKEARDGQHKQSKANSQPS